VGASTSHDPWTSTACYRDGNDNDDDDNDDVFLRFEDLTAVNNNITVFWGVTSYSLVDGDEGAPSADCHVDRYVIIRKSADSISTHFRYSYCGGKLINAQDISSV
jgi:hypothetical protein